MISTADPHPLLEAIDLRKRYGARVALDGVSFEIRPGEVVGLLGPNGAGKTTTLSILSTILRPDSGRVVFRDRPGRGGRRAGRALLGLVPQSLALYPTLTVAQNLRHFARMQGLGREDARSASARAIGEVGLEDRADEAMHSLSGGMKRRLNLACGIVHGPPLLLLDEPTVGVDLESRERILGLVRRLRDAGAGIIYSTHAMEEAERVCDRVLLIDRGRLVARGKVEELVLLAGGRSRMEITCRGEPPAAWAGGLYGVYAASGGADAAHISVEVSSHAEIGSVLEELQRSGTKVVDFSLHSPNLADAFLALTGRALVDSAEG